MSKRKDTESVRRYLSRKGYTLLGEYFGAKTNIAFFDNDGYYYYSQLTNLQSGKVPRKFHKSNPYTMQNINLLCKNKPFVLISDTYDGCRTDLELRCLINGCEEIFRLTWDEILQGRGCSYCHGFNVGRSNCLANRRKDLVDEWHQVLNGNLTPYDVTEGSAKVVYWKCKNDKHKPWKSPISSRTSKNSGGCPYCSGWLPTEDNNLNACHPQLLSEWSWNLNSKNPQEYTPSSNKKAWWKCKECDHVWEARIADRTSKDKMRGCPQCNTSKGEKRIREFLESKSVTYVPQKEFEGLLGVGGGNLSYDFYISEKGNNLLIEYQGRYHDGTASLQSKEDFIKQREHDRRKRDYASINNIKLLEIWYWDFDNIEEIMISQLDEFNIQ